jgi:hypothetical protein
LWQIFSGTCIFKCDCPESQSVFPFPYAPICANIARVFHGGHAIFQRHLKQFALLAAFWPALALAASPKPCLPADEAAKLVNKDVCVSAHVYDVVELPDGMRFLDICTPQTSDENCRFTIVSLPEDRDEVGELAKYRDMDVHIRGVVRPMHGRTGMVLSHIRQFNGGPPKFKPNPKLARGFEASESRPPINDPNLRAQGGGRAFMNSRDRAPLPVK